MLGQTRTKNKSHMQNPEVAEVSVSFIALLRTTVESETQVKTLGGLSWRVPRDTPDVWWDEIPRPGALRDVILGPRCACDDILRRGTHRY